MARNKALGPDGFIVEFFQVTWSFLREDILKIVEESRCTKRMHSTPNSTFLALIVKIENLEEF